MRALTIFVHLPLVLLPLAACASCSPSGAAAGPGLDVGLERPVELLLEPYAGRLHRLPVRIRGSSFPFLFDTGGGLTLIDPDLAPRAGCEPHGRLVGFRMSGERVEFQQCGESQIGLGPLELPRYLAIFDLMALLPDGLPPLSGVASLHTLQGHAFTLDLGENRLTIETDSSLAERVRDISELRLHLERDMEGRGLSAYIEAGAERGSLRLLLDSGNLAGFILAPHALEQLGVVPAPDGSVPDLELDIVGLGRVRTSIVVDDIRHDGVIGAEFLERIVLTLDLRTGRAWARLKS